MQEKQTISSITNSTGTHNTTSASVLKLGNESAHQQGIMGLEAPALEGFFSPQSEFSRSASACGGACVRGLSCYSGNIINERRSSLKMNWQCASPLKMFHLYWARPVHGHTSGHTKLCAFACKTNPNSPILNSLLAIRISAFGMMEGGRQN